MGRTNARSFASLGLGVIVVVSGCLTDFPALRSTDAQTGGTGGTGGTSADAASGGASEAGGGCDTGASATLAFPTAEGFGALSKGGRGGKVLRVTNLDDDGPGSLRDAMTQTGPRTIVFDVSGTINLASSITLTAAHSYVTVAGQTSPAGVQLRGSGLWIKSGFHDGVIRHLRIRPGGSSINGAVSMSGAEGEVRDVVLDHCDIMWSAGALVSVGSQVYAVTLQWNLVAEALGSTAGALIATSAGGTCAVHHNLLTRSAHSSPRFEGHAVFDFRNNLVFNWSNNNGAVFGSKTKDLSAFGNFVSNVYTPGSTSLSKSFWMANGSSLPSPDRGGTKVFATGNWGPLCDSGCADDWDNGYLTTDSGSILPAPEGEFRAATAFDAPTVKTDSTKDVRSRVLAGAGAAPWKRDTESQRVIDDVASFTSLPFRTDGGGPWPSLTGGAAPMDQDGDGIPDTWEIAHGLNPSAPDDGRAQACNGWTNLENYLNELAGDPIP